MFYTYLWLREDGTPYYVGKGTGRRGFDSDGHKEKRPKSRSEIITQEWASEEEAFLAEIFLIDYYGRKDLGTGCLRNLTHGGEGASGHKASEETRAKLRLRKNNWQGRKHTKESISRMKTSASKRRASLETRIAMSLAHGGWRHGTITAYRKHACRCELCRAWRHDYHLKFKAKAAGR